MTSRSASLAGRAFAVAEEHLHALGFPDPRLPPPLELVVGRGPSRSPVGVTGDGPPPSAYVAPAGHTPSAPQWEGPSMTQALSEMAAAHLSTQALVEEAIARARKAPELGAVVALDEQAVLEEAQRLDTERAAGTLRGPLHGVPITVKDIIDVAGLPTRGGSLAYYDEPVADAPAVARLRAAGALVLAKVATHEFALGVTTPQCANPLNPTRISGGSSGGSAIAVQTGVGLASLGTDTRASLRVPAALCGVVGFKPTFGRVPASGIIPLSWSIDHIGPVTRTVGDAAVLLEVLTGGPPLSYDGRGRQPGTIGVLPALLADADPLVAAACESALAALAGEGWRTVVIERPNLDDLGLANDLGLLISRSEASAFHRGQGTQVDLCIPEVRDQLLAGLTISASDYLDAQRQRARLNAAVLGQFARCDVVAMPTSPMVAPPKADYERYLLRLSRNTILWSLMGAPAVSVPCGPAEDGLPAGLQLAAAPGNEQALVDAGTALERAWGGPAPGGGR